MPLTKVSYSMIDIDTFNVDDYIPNTVDTSTTVCDSYFNLAIADAVGKKLIATGTYLINGPLSFESDSIYDFTGATFIAGPLQDLCFRTINKENIWVYGGSLTGVAGVTVLDTSHPTGSYWRGGYLWFEGCENVNVFYTQTYRFFGALNFYNCSVVQACNNFATDCAGGIQAVSDTDFAGSANMQGIVFTENTILHSGDDALTLLVRNTGVIFNSLITDNFVTKDPGVNGTVGLSKGIALYGDFGGTGTFRVYNVNVSNNIGYYMGQSFIRAQNVIECVFKGNVVDTYGVLGGDNAYTIGYDVNTGADSCIVDGNIAINPANPYVAMHIAFAARMRIVNNYLKSPVPDGQAALLMLSCTHGFVSGNILINTLGPGLQLDSGCVSNQVQNNDVLITAVTPISNGGTATVFLNNNGYVSKKTGTATIAATGTTVLVTHGLTSATAGQVKVTITPTSNYTPAAQVWVDTITSTTFNIRVDAGVTSNSTFQWTAEQITT
jgi:hypothetical protein